MRRLIFTLLSLAMLAFSSIAGSLVVRAQDHTLEQ
jgi:hypothetical protein